MMHDTHQKVIRQAVAPQALVCRIARVFELCDRRFSVDSRVALAACDDRVGCELAMRRAR
jgi:hypothetical protein